MSAFFSEVDAKDEKTRLNHPDSSKYISHYEYVLSRQAQAKAQAKAQDSDDEAIDDEAIDDYFSLHRNIQDTAAHFNISVKDIWNHIYDSDDSTWGLELASDYLVVREKLFGNKEDIYEGEAATNLKKISANNLPETQSGEVLRKQDLKKEEKGYLGGRNKSKKSRKRVRNSRKRVRNSKKRVRKSKKRVRK